jgi:hypothetical protein
MSCMLMEIFNVHTRLHSVDTLQSYSGRVRHLFRWQFKKQRRVLNLNKL